jgi:hypothetical protein
LKSIVSLLITGGELGDEGNEISSSGRSDMADEISSSGKGGEERLDDGYPGDSEIG